MNPMRLTVGIMFVVFAARTGTLAMAKDIEQPSAASICQTDAPELSATVPVSDTTAPVPAQQGSTAPSSTKSQGNGLDGCFLPFCCNAPCPCFYGQVEALFMKQDPQFTRQPIIVSQTFGSNTTPTLLSTSDLDMNFDPGLQATVGMRLCGCWALEFEYFGLFGGNASAGTVRPVGGFITFPTGAFGNVFANMSAVQVNYSSSVQSFAVNLPCCCGCCDECCDECGCGQVGDECSCGKVGNRCGCGQVGYRSFEWFAGFRYLNISQRLGILAQAVAFPSASLEEGTYDISTTNNLFGAQLGARLRRLWGRFGWEATGMAGVFGNAEQETQSVTDFPNFPLRPTVSTSGGEVAFVGEINLSALYRLTDVWILKAGYNLMWIDGLALAPDQLDFNFATSPSGNQLQNGGAMFLQGVNVGLEARW